MCRKCFYDYENYAKLYKKLKENLYKAMEKITTQARLPPLANCTVTPTRKRNKEGGENSFPARKQMRESSTDTSSPPVTVRII